MNRKSGTTFSLHEVKDPQDYFETGDQKSAMVQSAISFQALTAARWAG
jgi:hypothetical protein